MADITGSTDVGGGVSIAYDVNPTAPSAKLTLKFEGQSLGSATINSSDASASIGGSYAGTGVKATVTANWSTDKITYSVKLNPPVGKTTTYNGTVVSW